MWKHFNRPHSIIVTVLIFLFIWFMDAIRLNMHFLDPFNNSIRDYEITDIVYSQFTSGNEEIDNRIVLVNTELPDRQRLAAMIERLSAAGARVIGVDVLLDGRKDSVGDSLLRAGIERARSVVLATQLHDYREDVGYFESEEGCDPYFCDVAASGFANFPTNEYRTIRFFSPREPLGEHGSQLAFAVRVVQNYDPGAVSRLLERHRSLSGLYGPERIYYTSNENGFIHLTSDNVLQADTATLRHQVKDKIVLMGYIGTYDREEPLLDRYFTPLNPRYTGRTEPDMYGVVIHANIARMILDGDYVRHVPVWVSRVLAVLFCFVNVLFIHGIYHRFNQAFHPITRLLQLVEFMFVFFIVALLFYQFRIRWDFGLGILALLLAYDIVMMYESFLRQKIPLLDRLPKEMPWPRRRPAPEVRNTEADAIGNPS